MICPICQTYCQAHPSLTKHQKCGSCGFTCPDPVKENITLDQDFKQKEPSTAVKKALGLNED